MPGVMDQRHRAGECLPGFQREPGACHSSNPSKRIHQSSKARRAAALPASLTAQTSGLGIPESPTCCAWVHSHSEHGWGQWRLSRSPRTPPHWDRPVRLAVRIQDTQGLLQAPVTSHQAPEGLILPIFAF